MRNLKKVLSLALALVMLLGMMVVGAGATSFKDDADIKNQEAVDVVSGIGILTGVGDNTFNPEGTLTRAEAAVVIAKLDLGAAFGNLETTNASTFKDVAAGSGYGWAKPYIDYCYARGLIAGDGNGYFFPAKEVSGVEFGLMVSRVLGYEDANENIGGADWQVNAAALARKAGLTVNVTLAHPTAMTRDEMAQVAYNALTADVVEYDGRAITIGEITIPAGKAAPKQHNINSNYAHYINPSNNTTDPNIQLCEEKFPALKLNINQEDAFSRPSNTWVERQPNGTVKTLNTTVQDVALTYTTSVARNKIYSDLGMTAADSVPYFVNGAPQADLALSRTNTASIGGNGVLTQVFTNSQGYPIKVVEIHTYVGRVSAVNSAKGTINVVAASSTRNPGSLNNTFEAEGFENREVVLYTAALNGTKYSIQSVEHLGEPTTGTLTKWVGKTPGATTSSGESNFTVDSNDPYKYSKDYCVFDIQDSESEVWQFAVNRSEINVYTDQYGYAIFVSGVEGVKNYAAVIGVGSTNPYGDETTGVTLLLADGTRKSVTATRTNGSASLSDKTVISGSGVQKVDDLIGDVVTYAEKDDGTYELTLAAANKYTVASTTAADCKFVNGRSALTLKDGSNPAMTKYTTSRTVFFVAEKAADADTVTYNVYTGYSAMPSFDTTKGIKGFAIKTSDRNPSQVDAVYIAAENLSNTTAAITYFVKAKDADIQNDSTGTYYILPAVVDGEVTEIKVAVTNIPNNSDEGLYAVKNVRKDSNDIITGYTVASTDAFGAANGGRNGQVGVVAANGVVLGIGNTKTEQSETDLRRNALYMAYEDTTKVFSIPDDYSEINLVDIGTVNTDVNDLVYAAVKKDSNGNEISLTNVFVVEDGGADAVTSTGYTVEVSGSTDNMSYTISGDGKSVTDGALTGITAHASVVVDFTADTGYVFSNGSTYYRVSVNNITENKTVAAPTVTRGVADVNLKFELGSSIQSVTIASTNYINGGMVTGKKGTQLTATVTQKSGGSAPLTVVFRPDDMSGDVKVGAETDGSYFIALDRDGTLVVTTDSQKIAFDDAKKFVESRVFDVWYLVDGTAGKIQYYDNADYAWRNNAWSVPVNVTNWAWPEGSGAGKIAIQANESTLKEALKSMMGEELRSDKAGSDIRIENWGDVTVLRPDGVNDLRFTQTVTVNRYNNGTKGDEIGTITVTYKVHNANGTWDKDHFTETK